MRRWKFCFDVERQVDERDVDILQTFAGSLHVQSSVRFGYIAGPTTAALDEEGGDAAAATRFFVKLSTSASQMFQCQQDICGEFGAVTAEGVQLVVAEALPAPPPPLSFPPGPCCESCVSLLTGERGASNTL